MITPALLNPLTALHSYWHQTDMRSHVVVAGAGVAGALAKMDWAALASATGLLVMVVGGTAIELWKRFELAKFEISKKRRESIEVAHQNGLIPDTRPDRQAGGLRP